MGAERRGRLPHHAAAEGRHHGQRAHERRVDGLVLDHLGGPQQLAPADERNVRGAGPFLGPASVRLRGEAAMARAAGLTSFLIGTAAALALLAGWRMPAGHAGGCDRAERQRRRLAEGRPVTHRERLRRRDISVSGPALTTTVVLRNTRHAALRLRPRARVVGDVSVTERDAGARRPRRSQLFRGPLSRLAQATATPDVASAGRIHPGSPWRSSCPASAAKAPPAGPPTCPSLRGRPVIGAGGVGSSQLRSSPLPPRPRRRLRGVHRHDEQHRQLLRRRNGRAQRQRRRRPRCSRRSPP